MENNPIQNVPIRPITREPGFHWFGYYDKQQFDTTGRFLLGMEAGFEHRRPGPQDPITIGMIDTENKDVWIPLGQSRAWCWQSGCMLQWRPGYKNQILWNDRRGDQFITRILDIQTGEKKELPFAFFTVHPSGNSALSLDFERLEYMRPGYGYAQSEVRNRDVLAPEDMGIYHLDLRTGQKKLILSLRRILDLPHPGVDWKDGMHYVNCLLFNPTGSRFVFLHRWRPDRGRGWPFKTRMLIADPDGSRLSALVPGGCGHFNWRDDDHLIVQEGGFSIYQDGYGKTGQIGGGIIPNSGGHISYLADKQWLAGDTYPDKDRLQHLYLYHCKSGRFIELGAFYQSPQYDGSQSGREDNEWRCDLHPRLSRDRRLLCIDSPHEGRGRQMYLLNLNSVLET